MSQKNYLFSTRKLGLAAYIHMRGGELMEKTRREGYKLLTDKPLKEWSIQYANSCCKRHDQALCGLRDMPEED